MCSRKCARPYCSGFSWIDPTFWAIKNEALLDEGEFTLYYNVNKEYDMELIEGSDIEYKELDLTLIPLK